MKPKGGLRTPQMWSTTLMVARFVTAVARVVLLEIKKTEKRLLGHVEEPEHKPLFAADRSTPIACFPLAYSPLEHLIIDSPSATHMPYAILTILHPSTWSDLCRLVTGDPVPSPPLPNLPKRLRFLWDQPSCHAIITNSYINDVPIFDDETSNEQSVSPR